MCEKKIVVVKILNEFQVVLNIGSKDGITDNTKFLIYQLDDEIIDPETKENLGKLEIVKGKGKVIHLQENLCTIESIEKENSKRIIKRSNPILYGVAGMFSSEVEEFSPNSIPFNDVKLGDFAKII